MSPEEAQYAAETHLQLSRSLRENARLKAAEERNLPAWGEMQGRLEAASARAKAAETESDELRKELEFTSRRLAAVEEVHAMPLQLRNERDAALQRAEKAEARVAELEALIAAGGAP